MKRVIFLCSANYYRSRFAEHLFNHLASEIQLDWHADSRGVMTDRWGNIGPISDHTVEALEARRIPLLDTDRHPRSLAVSDLENADLVIAVKEMEHRPEIRRQFPEWEARVEYWDVHDLDCAEPADALPYLEQKVKALVERLRG